MVPLIVFLTSPANEEQSRAPTQPHGVLWAFLYLGVEDSKRKGNEVNHLAAFDPNVEDHTLIPNLAWGNRRSGNLIRLVP